MSVFQGHPYTSASGQTPRDVIVEAATMSGVAGLVADARPPASRTWQVHRVTVQGASAAGDPVGRAYVCVGGVTTANIVEGTDQGDFDTDDTTHPIVVAPGSLIAVWWPALTDADTATARFELVEVS